ncbi:MAG: N-6 DNA methylase [Phycisphaerales bacterium]|nr:N-6 DNA methylase [Phycisphaerales bacterium]
MTSALTADIAERLTALRACLDGYARRYRELRGADDFGGYLAAPASRGDEEVLTEPVLADLLERVLGFPRDAYFPQLGRGGLKPDFTPIDLIAHPFVLDAKGSDQSLGVHERQIRRYIEQRSLDYGVLFNLREVRVYRRAQRGHDERLSFRLLPLWHVARGEALPTVEVSAFTAFCERFSHRAMTTAEKVGHIRDLEPWAARLRRGEAVEVDVDFLTDRLRALALRLVDDAAARPEALAHAVALSPHRAEALQRELELLALDLAPGTDLGALPSTLESWRTGDGLAGRVWHQYLLRVAYLALTRVLLYRAWEDVEFVDQYLYDGGFGFWYERLSQDLGLVLDEAFLHGAQRYRWLYGDENNYDWYRPSDDALVEVLYSLAPVPLGRLDADVLGDLYQLYVDEIDRDRLGQFYTPRPVVRFMLDRAGFRGRRGVLRTEADRRLPRRVFDFATGSGGFLVEAARRVIDDGGGNPEDPEDLREVLHALVSGSSAGRSALSRTTSRR